MLYNDEIKELGEYNINGERTGEWTTYNHKDFLILQGNYQDGKKHGVWLSYCDYQKNVIVDTTQYLYGIKNGAFTAYYLNEAIHVTGHYTNDIPDGNWIEYDLEGNISKSEYYKNGVKEGASRIYKDGKIIWVNNFLKGKPYGWFKLYRYDQNVKEGIYQFGLKEGIWKYYHESAGIGVLGNYVADKMDGVWIYYDSDSLEIGKAIFSEGKPLHTNGEVYLNEEDIMDFCETLYY